MHLSRRIDFKEYKFRSTINHSLVTEENIQTENAMYPNVPCFQAVRKAATGAGVTQRHRAASKIHAAGCDTLRKAYGK